LLQEGALGNQWALVIHVIWRERCLNEVLCFLAPGFSLKKPRSKVFSFPNQLRVRIKNRCIYHSYWGFRLLHPNILISLRPKGLGPFIRYPKLGPAPTGA
jgi:hypothetical protein